MAGEIYCLMVGKSFFIGDGESIRKKGRCKMVSRKMSVLTGVLLFASVSVQAATVYWSDDSATSDYSGNWTDLYQSGVQAGWNAGSYPNAVDADTAGPNLANYQTSTILLNVNVTVGKLQEGNRHNLVLNSDGTHNLTFDVSSGSAALSHTSRQGAMTINPNLVLNDPLVITRSGGVSTADAMTVNGSLSGTGALSLSLSGNRGVIAIAGGINMVGSLTTTDTDANASYQYTTLSGTIGSNVTSLTKNGPGLLTLSGSNNAYTGGTTINGGTVAADAAGALGSGNVSVAAGALLKIASGLSVIDDGAVVNLLSNSGTYGVIELGSGVSDTVAALKFDGVSQAAGTWGATGSGATHINDNYFTGAGMLNVVPEPVTLALLGMGGVGVLLRRKRA